MRKLAAIILSSVLVLSLAACGNDQPEGSTAQPASSQTEASASTPAADGKAAYRRSCA